MAPSGEANLAWTSHLLLVTPADELHQRWIFAVKTLHKHGAATEARPHNRTCTHTHTRTQTQTHNTHFICSLTAQYMSSMKELTVQGDGCLESIHRRRRRLSSSAPRICAERARLRVCVWLRVHERARPLFCSVGLGVVADRCPFFLAMQFITPLVVGDLWLCPDAHRTKRCISWSILYQTPESTAGEAKKI